MPWQYLSFFVLVLRRGPVGRRWSGRNLTLHRLVIERNGESGRELTAAEAPYKGHGTRTASTLPSLSVEGRSGTSFVDSLALCLIPSVSEKMVHFRDLD
jgi:hypothetical protein